MRCAPIDKLSLLLYIQHFSVLNYPIYFIHPSWLMPVMPAKNRVMPHIPQIKCATQNRSPEALLLGT